MILGRLNRLLRATSARFARPDDAWAARVLPEPERRVYLAMDGRDREHAVRTARRVLERRPDAPDALVRAALLHDCGKLVRPYRWLERVLVGLLAPPAPRARVPERLDLRALPRLSAAQVRRDHPAIGAALIRGAGGDERVATIVERHHAPGADADARALHDVDRLE